MAMNYTLNSQHMWIALNSSMQYAIDRSREKVTSTSDT